jgi:urease accessory protein
VLELGVAPLEAPIFLRLAGAWTANDADVAGRWNAEFIASRETAELRAETLQMGHSLRNLLRDLDVDGVGRLDAIGEAVAFPTAFTFAVGAWRIDAREALAGYLFAWVENQVMAAIKVVPLGQTQGQRILSSLAGRIAAIVESAALAGDADLSNFMPGLALASTRHESQYTRIFRS